ncbi:hypothetical protein [Microbacterium gorillae]|uniref:hypothetical protein n=1 Tax=Microbacterium gorillae TaxID=1231063 RepID=UPI000694A767|nr:hypothetical protein [Microbacterium gorillae]
MEVPGERRDPPGQDRSGNDTGAGAGAGAGADGGWDSSPQIPTTPGPGTLPAWCLEQDDMSPTGCDWSQLIPDDPTPATPDEPAFVIPTVYARDLVSFTPRPPGVTGEPDAAGLIGKPTNIVATATTHDLTGALFGHAVTVRFAPATYTFDYGDGATRTTTTGGATWADTAAAQFTDTPTAHAYRERGRYTAAVRVEYAAAVNFGDGTWRPVIGTVHADTSYGLRVYEPRTALVRDTCDDDPNASGC